MLKKIKKSCDRRKNFVSLKNDATFALRFERKKWSRTTKKDFIQISQNRQIKTINKV